MFGNNGVVGYVPIPSQMHISWVYTEGGGGLYRRCGLILSGWAYTEGMGAYTEGTGAISGDLS